MGWFTPTIINVNITPAVGNLGGKIHVDSIKKITHIEWQQENNQPIPTNCLDYTNTTANNLLPSVYNIIVTYGKQKKQITAIVPHVQIPVITKYVITHATTDFSRDGEITAILEYTPQNCSFLWTTGVVTEEPTLKNVLPGLYTVCPFDPIRKIPIPHLHNSIIAIVNSLNRI